LLLLKCRGGIVGQHQTQVIPSHFASDFNIGLRALRLQRAQQLNELVVTPARYCQNELQRLTTGQR
jgi:hypothetical protein